ncbi:MAG TPA: UDP-3-O-acyl-N-acetylglucosamine deacetylase [bacterium]|nr:UDP-3-O-acyl-N-acetylglucosamine deacetylase [bacterium]
MSLKQKTIAKAFRFQGKGLHTGSESVVTVSPAAEGSGIRFFRKDLGAEIKLSPFHVTNTARGTTLTGEKHAQVHTIEHFLAAVRGFQITNLTVEMTGEEMPIMDGSALAFCEALKGAGLVEQAAAADPLVVTEVVELTMGDVYLKAEPAEGLQLDVTISFPYPGLEHQNLKLRVSPADFEKELAPARTFCFEKEVEILRQQGLIKGGGLDCALVVGEKGVLNGPLRFPDEFVRHKTMDLLGDLSLLNRPLVGKITVRKAGHRTHVELAKALEEKFGKKSPATGAGNAKKGDAMLDIIEIQKLLPHRYPFLLVDRILELEPGKRVVGLKNVSMNEAFFQGHFPGHPVMPGVLILEALAQVGGVAVLAAREGDNSKIQYLAGIDEARFRKPVKPGDQLRLEVDVTLLRTKICKLSARAVVDGQVVTEAQITCALVDKGQAEDNA